MNLVPISYIPKMTDLRFAPTSFADLFAARREHGRDSPFLRRKSALRGILEQRRQAQLTLQALQPNRCTNPRCPACNPAPELTAAQRAELRWKTHGERV